MPISRFYLHPMFLFVFHSPLIYYGKLLMNNTLEIISTYSFLSFCLPFRSVPPLPLLHRDDSEKCVLVLLLLLTKGFPGDSVVKNPPANAGDTSSIPGLGRSPGEEIGNLLKYSCLGYPMDRRAIVSGVAKK